MNGDVPRTRRIVLCMLVIVVAAIVRLPGLTSRSIWYDEGITLLETAGHSRPDWPDRPTPAAAPKSRFVGQPSLVDVIDDLRRHDTHPPLYFMVLSLWRRTAGFSLEAARWLSWILSIGSVVGLYLLLRAARYEHALGATLFYALATGAVHNGHEARPYALAELLIVLAALGAVCTWRWASQQPGRALACALATALTTGAAFATDYLALFPSVALMLWLGWAVWPRSRLIGLVGPIAAMLAGSAVLPVLRSQLGARGHQFSGAVGIGREIQQMFLMNAQELGIALSVSGKGSRELVEGLAVVAAVISLTSLFVLSGLEARRTESREPRLRWMFPALAAAPTVGLLLLDMMLDKRLHEPRYLVFAVPFLAVVAAHGILRAAGRGQRWAILLFVGLVAIQLARVNWGFDRCVRDQTGSITRGLVEIMEGVEVPSRLVAVGGGFGQGDPAVWTWELDAATPMLVFGSTSDLDAVLDSMLSAIDIWITFATDRATLPVEQELVRRLTATGEHILVFRSPSAIHFVRRPPSSAGGPPPPGSP